MATIRELISKLEEIYSENGDLPVYMCVHDCVWEAEIDIEFNVWVCKPKEFCAEELRLPLRVLID